MDTSGNTKMSIEQKAKAYDEALDRMKHVVIVPKNEGALQALKEIIFPELKESEDERIRKSIIHILQVGGYMSSEEKDKAFAYLEKQKINTEGDFGRGYDCGYEACLNSHGAEWFEKQKEQKPITTGVSFNPDDYEVVMEENATSLNQKEQKPSEEDEKDVAHIIRVLDDCYAYGKHDLSKTDHENLIGTLKSLHPQPKQEWSEEDEKTINNACCWIAEYAGYLMDKNYSKASMLMSLTGKLKSLRPQLKKEWSEEDETCLEDALWCVMKTRHFVAKDACDLDACRCAEKWLKSLPERFVL